MNTPIPITHPDGTPTKTDPKLMDWRANPTTVPAWAKRAAEEIGRAVNHFLAHEDDSATDEVFAAIITRHAPTPDAPSTGGFVMQTKFGLEGNCFDACLASLLGMPLDALNYFRGEDTWYPDLQRWLAPRGLAYVEVDCIEPSPFYRFPLPLLAIAGGSSPRGVDGGHSVIMELHGWERRVVHDPHPDGTGLTKIKTLGFLVRRLAP